MKHLGFFLLLAGCRSFRRFGFHDGGTGDLEVVYNREHEPKYTGPRGSLLTKRRDFHCHTHSASRIAQKPNN